jgi:hypothetical protein
LKATVSQVEASGPPANFRPLARACIRLLKVLAAVTSATGKLRAELPAKPDRDAAAEEIALAEVRSGQSRGRPLRSGPVLYITRPKLASESRSMSHKAAKAAAS